MVMVSVAGNLVGLGALLLLTGDVAAAEAASSLIKKA